MSVYKDEKISEVFYFIYNIIIEVYICLAIYKELFEALLSRYISLYMSSSRCYTFYMQCIHI